MGGKCGLLFGGYPENRFVGLGQGDYLLGMND